MNMAIVVSFLEQQFLGAFSFFFLPLFRPLLDLRGVKTGTFLLIGKKRRRKNEVKVVTFQMNVRVEIAAETLWVPLPVSCLDYSVT